MLGYWHSGWHMWWMAASWVVGLVVAAFFWAWVHGNAFQTQGPQGGPPESILKRRYARGEISTEQYERQLTELRR
jgi:uncharacterized membrane protein